MTRPLSHYWRQIAHVSFARIYSLVIGIVSLAIVARVLGPEGQGTVAAAAAWAALLAALAGLSLGQVSQHRLQKERAANWNAVVSSLALMTVVLSIVAGAVAVVLFLVTHGRIFGSLRPEILAFALILVPLIIFDDYANNLFAAAKTIPAYNRIQIVGRSISFAVLVVLVGVMALGVFGALGAQLLGQAIIGISSFIILWRSIGTFESHTREVRELLSGAAKLHLNTIGTFVLAQSSVLVLNALAPTASVGWYSLAWQLITILLVIPQSASLVIYSLIAESNPDRAWLDQRRMLVKLMAAMLLLAGIAYAAAPFAITLLAGESFRPAAELFRILLPALLGLSFAQLMTPQWITRGIFLPTSIISLVIAFVHVIATIFLTNAHGAVGAAWATGLCLSLGPLLVQGYFFHWCNRASQASA